ncbi:MAG: hypothetical protein EBU90_31480 [Proteobacteria bacterium]|nr:hypothetical protein [Pseudomonadota bacterium]
MSTPGRPSVANKAEEAFQEVYDRLSIEYAGVILRETFHNQVYQHIVEQCAMIASAHSPANEDIGEIIRRTMGLR